MSLKCDECGRFISYNHLESGLAVRRLITPDSELSEEKYETLCTKHADYLHLACPDWPNCDDGVCFVREPHLKEYEW